MTRYTIRHPTGQDKLEALWPEIHGHHVNLDQVFVAVGEDGALLAGALLFHGGHSVAYVGAMRVLPAEGAPWLARALWQAVARWAKAHGVTRLGHGAGTEACVEALRAFGAAPGRAQVLMEVDL